VQSRDAQDGVKSASDCRPEFRFAGHRAIVTGASRGIGRAVADALAVAGAEVHVFDVGEPDSRATFPHRLFEVNIADAASVSATVAALPGPVTLLVNNAGITRDRSLAKMTDDEWSSVIDVNLTGAFNMIRAVVPAMAARGFGRVVNITSINGLRGKFGQANYAAAKAGLIGLTKTAAREFGKRGVTVNAVAPGMVMTSMARALPQDVLERAANEAVLARLAEPRDISDAVLFLLSDAASAITGEVLQVDAGQYI
jgi:acetoacetyl-CoA reductase/3-oxoacyl-[acyl-carrier protein] reductase